MLIENKKTRNQLKFLCLEEFIPSEHLLRKIDRAVDFRKIYEFVRELYCKDNGRPSVDPVILIKMVLIQHLYGITSLRKLVSEVLSPLLPNNKERILLQIPAHVPCMLCARHF